MIDDRFNDTGDIELEDFGDDTADIVFRECYPVLDSVLSSDAVLQDDAGEGSGGSAAEIKRAVEHERRRLRPVQETK